MRLLAGIAVLLCGTVAHAACLPPGRGMTIIARGDTIEARGLIVTGDAATLAATVATIHARSIILDSPGGNVAEAAAMASTIRLAGLDVSVPRGMCASACFMLLAAGRTRTVSLRSQIGVHRALACDGDAAASEAGTEVEARTAASLGATPAIVHLMTTIPQPGIAWLDRAELGAMGVTFTD